MLFKQLYQIFKKLVLILATLMLIIKANKKDVLAIDKISCIYPLILLKKNEI